MSRTTLLASVTGLVLVAGLSAPAVAAPALDDDVREGVCLRLDPDEEQREGLCVYVPITLPVR